MSKPKLLDAYTRESKTITAKKTDYAIALKWTDENPENEDRLGYFVSIDESNSGMSIVKASECSKVLGVTVDSPGFATNVTQDICESHKVLPSHAHVCFSGFASVIDNGRCEINSRCVPAEDGTAIPSTTGVGYKIVDRVDENHVLLHINPLLQLEVVGKRLKISY